jgi:hypothetical protein
MRDFNPAYVADVVQADRIQIADWRWRIIRSCLRAKDGFATSIGRLWWILQCAQNGLLRRAWSAAASSDR